MTLTLELPDELASALKSRSDRGAFVASAVREALLREAQTTEEADGLPDSLATMLLSEETIAEIWNDPEEDKAWAHL